MDLYEAFKSIIEKNDIKILDDASKCEALLKQQGVSGNDLDSKLFFVILRQNVPLKIRTITYANKNYSNYTLSVKIFCELFGSENLSNEYEDILIRHISLIVSVFEAEKVIGIDLKPQYIERKTLGLSKALLEVLDEHGLSALENTNSLKSILDDACDEKGAVRDFISFLGRVNEGTVNLDDKQEVEDIKNFAKLLGKHRYLPIIVILEKLQRKEASHERVATNADGWAQIDWSPIVNPEEDESRPLMDYSTVDDEKESKKNSPKQKLQKNDRTLQLALLFFLILIVISMLIPATCNSNNYYSGGNTRSSSSSYSSNSSHSDTALTNTARTLYVNADGLNVRSQPSPDSHIVGTLAQGDSVTTMAPVSQKWIYVKGKYSGYVNSDYLSESPVSKRIGSSNSSQNTNIPGNLEDNLDLSPKDTKFKE